MAWVVDTCLLIDVLEDDPEFGRSSARLLDDHAADGLVLCPVSYVELAPAFEGSRDLQEEFLSGVGVALTAGWEWRDTLAAHAGWHRLIRLERRGSTAKRPVADILIGAYARRFQGLLTRKPSDFRSSFPDLTLIG